MATNGNPPPTWPIEPTVLYVVSYFANNALNTAPTLTDPVLYGYNEAIEKSKIYILNNNNNGVCIIQPITCSIIYPSIPWEDA